MSCSQCGKPLMDGASFCADCGAKQGSVAVAVDPNPPAVAMKACPFCGERILAAAIKCRFCSSELNKPNSGGVSVQGPAVSATQPTIIVQNVQSNPTPGLANVVVREVKNPGVAFLLSLIFPGGGQFYNGHAGKGIIVLLTFWLVVPYLWSLFDAYNSANRINRVGF